MITCLLPLLFAAWPALPPPKPAELWEVQGPRTVYYWYSADCVICVRQSPIVNQLYNEGWPIFRTDADTVPNRRLAEGYGIDAAPTFSIFVGGKEIARHVGPKSYDDLLEWIKSKGTQQTQQSVVRQLPHRNYWQVPWSSAQQAQPDTRASCVGGTCGRGR